MASIKFGHIVAEARGKLGDTVYARNHSGPFVRINAPQRNPNTNYQQLYRQYWKSNSQLWSKLSDQQRLGWHSLARQVSLTNIFGDSIIMTGYMLFMRLNQNLSIAIGRQYTDPPPGIPPIPSIVSINLHLIVNSDFTIEYIATDPLHEQLLIVATSKLFNPGVSYFRGTHRILTTRYLNYSDTFNITADYYARFGPWSYGQKVSVELHAINTEHGWPSPRLTRVVSAE